MYKLIAIDLDGTLLNSYGEVSQRNKEAIRKCEKQGSKVIIASGRPMSSAKSYAIECNTSNYIICGNGSILYDTENTNIIYSKCIDKQRALQIIKICDDNSIFYSLYTESLTIAKSINYNISFYNNENKKVANDKKTNIKIVDDIYKYIEDSQDIKILKITICNDSKVIFDGILRKLKQIKNVDILEVEHMARKSIKFGTSETKVEYFYTEITSKGVNKWNAIQYLADNLGIPTEEIMAIGDNMNDKQMIENAGLGIIMQNSAPYMKEFADVVVADNNNDGVAEALERYVIKE